MSEQSKCKIYFKIIEEYIKCLIGKNDKNLGNDKSRLKEECEES